MPRAAAAHGTYRAYLRCRGRDEGACALCLAAAADRNARNSKSAEARLKKQSAALDSPPVTPLAPAPTTEEGHISRLEVLKEQLEQSRETIARLKQSDPARVYLLMREQRETVREISEIQGNGQVKGVTLADQLAAAREARAQRAAGA